MKKLFKTNKSKWILTAIAFVLVAVVLVGFGVKLNRQEKTVTVSSLNYAVGGISSTTGKTVETKLSAYTKSMCKVDGMEIELKDDSTITYKVAFYDEDKNFIEMTDAYSDDFENTNIAQDAEYFRVVITPNQIDGEDVKVTILNITHYANMLKITYNK